MTTYPLTAMWLAGAAAMAQQNSDIYIKTMGTVFPGLAVAPLPPKLQKEFRERLSVHSGQTIIQNVKDKKDVPYSWGDLAMNINNAMSELTGTKIAYDMNTAMFMNFNKASEGFWRFLLGNNQPELQSAEPISFAGQTVDPIDMLKIVLGEVKTNTPVYIPNFVPRS